MRRRCLHPPLRRRSNKTLCLTGDQSSSPHPVQSHQFLQKEVGAFFRVETSLMAILLHHASPGPGPGGSSWRPRSCRGASSAATPGTSAVASRSGSHSSAPAKIFLKTLVYFRVWKTFREKRYRLLLSIIDTSFILQFSSKLQSNFWIAFSDTKLCLTPELYNSKQR